MQRRVVRVGLLAGRGLKCVPDQLGQGLVAISVSRGAGRDHGQGLRRVQDAPALRRPGVDPDHRRAHVERQGDGMAGPADEAGARPIPDRDDEVRLLDQHLGGERHPLGGLETVGLHPGDIGRLLQAGEVEGGDGLVAIGQFEHPGLRLQVGDDLRPRPGRRAAIARAGQQAAGFFDGLGMGVDGGVQRPTERQRRDQFPAPRQRLG
jgi:hypothetical protein